MMNDHTPLRRGDQVISLYDRPDLYELALSRSENVAGRDCVVLERLWDTLLALRPVRILELGAGTSPHGRCLAGRGFAVTALDTSAPMLQEVERRARLAQLDIELCQQDATDFDISGPPFDVVIFMYQTLSTLARTDALYAHFRAVARHLRPGGLYLVDVDRAHRAMPTLAELPLLVSDDCFTAGALTVRRRLEIVGSNWQDDCVTWSMRCAIRGVGVSVDTQNCWTVRHLVPATLGPLVDAAGHFECVGYFSATTGEAGIPEDASHYLGVFRRW